jgi:hypothetical protein
LNALFGLVKRIGPAPVVQVIKYIALHVPKHPLVGNRYLIIVNNNFAL